MDAGTGKAEGRETVRQSEPVNGARADRQGGVVREFLEFIEQAPDQSVRDVTGRILLRCRTLTSAEAGTVFILRLRDGTRWLEAMSVQNDVIETGAANFAIPVDERSIAGYVAATGRTLFIDDAYAIPDSWPFRFNSAFDLKSGFRTRSILCFAMRSYEQRTIGVVQLINRRGGDGRIYPFLAEHEEMIAPVNHLVGRAIERIDSLEQIAEQNRLLRVRNEELRIARERADALRAETERAFMATVELLGRAAERHDYDTGNHTQRVNEYSFRLARLAELPDEFCSEIRYLAALHDVGKMAVDKAILHKPARLTDEEYKEMQRHTVYGFEILSVHERMAMAAEIAHSHHEKWDGSGYPRGLVGEAIPIAARIVAIADVYDALRSDRPYKAGFDHARTVEIMTRGDSRIDPARHFDPRLLRLFAENQHVFDEVWTESLGRRTAMDPKERSDEADVEPAPVRSRG